MRNKKILIDTDMGNDDIMAISILLISPIIQIGGITVVNGVSSVNKGFINLIKILRYCRKYKDLFITQGASEALVEKKAQFPERDRERAENLTLLKELALPQITAQTCKYQPVENLLIEKVKEGYSTILALGPVTNIAKTVNKYKNSFVKNVREIIMMGGGINKGNVPPLKSAEYNIWIDPEAASIVFNSNIPVTMVGIDATSYVPATETFRNKVKITKPKTPEGKILKEIIVNNNSDLDYFYDPLVSAILVDPAIITRKKLLCSVDIILSGLNRGQTIIQKSNKKNVQVVLEVDSNKFYRMILNYLTKI